MSSPAARTAARTATRISRTFSRSLATKTAFRTVRTVTPYPEKLGVPLRHHSAAAASYSNDNDGQDDNYVSPMQDLFDTMKQNGPTSLGTTEFVPVNTKFLKCGVAESALRFTTTAYGRLTEAPFVHPAEHRVVLQISTDKLPLTATEQELLKEIVGSRWNDERQELRLTSDQFGSRIENKRHLVSMLDRIILSCQRLAKELEELPLVESNQENI